MTAFDPPRHRTIERSLRERIAVLHAGDPLPSDADLCAEFSVSRMTARSAMQRLADEGLILRLPGRGSFVAEPTSHRRADRLMSFSSEMTRLGRRPSSLIVAREIRPAWHAVATELQLPLGAAVVFLRRVRCADEQPVALETAVLIGQASAAIMAADLRHDSLHAVLAAAGWTLRRGTALVTATLADREDAALLGVEPGAPMLVERRVIVDGRGMRVEATESRYRSDRYAIDVRFDVEAPHRLDSQAAGGRARPVPLG